MVRLTEREGYGERPRSRRDRLQLRERRAPLAEFEVASPDLKLELGLDDAAAESAARRGRRDRSPVRAVARRHGRGGRPRARLRRRPRRRGRLRRGRFRLHRAPPLSSSSSSCSDRGRVVRDARELDRASVVRQRASILALPEHRVREERRVHRAQRRRDALTAGPRRGRDEESGEVLRAVEQPVREEIFHLRARARQRRRRHRDATTTGRRVGDGEIALLLGRSLAGAVRCAARRRCPARRVRGIGSRHVPFERTKSGAFYNYTLVFHPSLGFNT